MGRHKKGHLSWVVIVARGGDANTPEEHFLCERCGEKRILKLPLEIKTVVAHSNAFLVLHAECKDPQLPLMAEQTSLPVGTEKKR